MSSTGIHKLRLTIAIAAALVGQQAVAQSTASQILEEVTVTGEKIEGGLIRKETVAKSRSTVGQDYFETQTAGQTVFQSINLVPGVNFVNSDPYGSSGGNIRLRGFDGNRIALLSDGVPLNDTGNYAIFTNQQLDSEIVDRVNVNLGTTDVDSPTASATGGTINLITNVPKDQFAGMAKASFGEDNYSRYALRMDTGEFGPWKTKAFLEGSMQEYDKFKGPGELEKRQINGRIYQELGDDGDFLSLAFHGNRNRNSFLRNISKQQIALNGMDLDNASSCKLAGGGPGAQNDPGVAQGDSEVANLLRGPTGNQVLTRVVGNSGCTNYFNLRRNPSDTANIRGQASIGVTDSLRWTFDPSFQYVLANGGGFNSFAEMEPRLRGGRGGPGADLNADGDFADTISVYAPNTTMTRRYGVSTSLIWDIDDTNTLRFGYTLDYGRHRQTGQVGPLDRNTGSAMSDFAGRDGPSVATADGSTLRIRDRLSIARLNQASLSYSTKLFEERVGVNLGVRAPFFRRELNQRCFTQLSGGGTLATGVTNPGNGQQLCTTEVPATSAADNTVTFTGRGTGRFLRPFGTTVKFEEVLPNVGLSYELDDVNQLFFNYAKGFSAPRTDNLYLNPQNLDSIEGEGTDALEVGYRYQTGRIQANAVLWTTMVTDRIVSAFDQETGLSVDRNVGDVDMVGFDASIGAEIFQGLKGYLTGSYIDSEIKEDFQTAPGVFLRTKGLDLVETPDFQFGARVEYRIGGFTAGLQGKYVDDRFSTDLNDERAPSYKVYDLDASYEWDLFGTRTSIQFNVNNLFDEDYLGNITTATTANIANRQSSAGPFYSIGAPRTVQFTVQTEF